MCDDTIFSGRNEEGKQQRAQHRTLNIFDDNWLRTISQIRFNGCQGRTLQPQTGVQSFDQDSMVDSVEGRR